MPVTVCWAAKGGSGTTVVAATIALACPTDALLVDLDGELPAVLGLPEPGGQGVADWLASEAPPDALDDLTIDVDRTTRLIPRGSAALDRSSPRWSELGPWLATRPASVVDAGSHPPPDELLGPDTRNLLVTRACYLALAADRRRAVPPRRGRARRRARTVATRRRRRAGGRGARRRCREPRPGRRPRSSTPACSRPACRGCWPGSCGAAA